jgi:hypothetical protein
MSGWRAGSSSSNTSIWINPDSRARASREDIKSRYYDNQGNTFDYVYELEGDTLTIWGGERGSPAFYEGTFSADGDRLTGAWVYPGGGGYSSTATRVR